MIRPNQIADSDTRHEWLHSYRFTREVWRRRPRCTLLSEATVPVTRATTGTDVRSCHRGAASIAAGRNQARRERGLAVEWVGNVQEPPLATRHGSVLARSGRSFAYWTEPTLRLEDACQSVDQDWHRFTVPARLQLKVAREPKTRIALGAEALASVDGSLGWLFHTSSWAVRKIASNAALRIRALALVSRRQSGRPLRRHRRRHPALKFQAGARRHEMLR